MNKHKTMIVQSATHERDEKEDEAKIDLNERM